MIRFIRYRCDNKWCNSEYSPISLYITFDVGYNLIYPYPVGASVLCYTWITTDYR